MIQCEAEEVISTNEKGKSKFFITHISAIDISDEEERFILLMKVKDWVLELQRRR